MKNKSFVISIIGIAAVLAMVTFGSAYGFKKGMFSSRDWTKGDYFKLKSAEGRDTLIDPSGKAFYSKGMVYDYGPDKMTLINNVNIDRVFRDLGLIKKNGFNTLNLYGDLFFDEILSWCDKNKIAVYPRLDYTNWANLTKERAEFPDFMDPEFRKIAKQNLDKMLNITKDHRSVLALDMDQRWLFDVDYCGRERGQSPKLGPKSLEYLPAWLENKYKDIGKLNRIWKKEYVNFSDILNDVDVIIGDYIRPLSSFPWRIDFVEYTLWTMNDFLKELTAHMRTVDPNHLITYTTDLPEVIPFPVSTVKNSGIDFISAVHYNSIEDFNRDWTGNAELIYMTKWMRDLYGMPVFINELGFRTSPLQQDPPNMTYAAAKSNDENHVAEIYLRCQTLMNTYPWLLGWSYFKWYDKAVEGDFGYIRDNGSLKPVSRLGQYINKGFSLKTLNKQKPLAWIYYPIYDLASLYPSYQQYKSLVLMLEDDFLSQYETMIKKEVKNTADLNYNKIAYSQLLDEMVAVFNEKWLGFNFTSSIPDDDLPVILAGRSLEQLSLFDRNRLASKKTITMVLAGISDERYNETEYICISLLGLKLKAPLKDLIIKDSMVTVSMGEIKYSGFTPWMISIDKEDVGDCKILATFSNDKPAIIQSRDGRHVAFLYDPLTWDGRNDEISRNVSEQAKILKYILKGGGGGAGQL